MNKRIGNVKLNYDFYDGADSYSDGDEIEEKMLELSKNGKWEEAVYNSNEWAILYHFADIRGNIIDWYPFNENASVLEVGSGCGAISGFLCRKAKRVVGVELSERRAMINAYRNKECDNLEIIVGNFKNIKITEKFDYITLIGVFEYASSYMGTDNPFEDMLNAIRKYLKPDGKIFIAIENKMGLKYLNGAKEDHTGKSFSGIEDYRYVSRARTFSKPEMIRLLRKCGVEEYSFYYPTPDYKLPDTIYSDSILPMKGDIRTWGTNYDTTRIAFYNEAIAFDQVCDDGMYDYFSNSFLVVCGKDDSKVAYAHYTNDRKSEFQTKTVIERTTDTNDKYAARKSYLNEKGGSSYDVIGAMDRYCDELQAEFKNVHYVKPNIANMNELEYEYIEGEPIDRIIAGFVHQPERMAAEMKKMLDWCFEYDNSAETDFEVTPDYLEFFGDNAVKTSEKSLKVTNIDMIFQNLLVKDKKIYCIDYEWIYTFPIPIEFMKYRCVSMFWQKYNMYFSQRLGINDLAVKSGIKEQNIETYKLMAKKLAENVYGKNGCFKYEKKYRKPAGMIMISGI